MQAPPPAALPVALALELPAGARLARDTLSRDEAAELAGRVAADLHGLLPAVADARLALAGALFDPVEMLRPGFPVWGTLEELARRVPRGQLENVVAFGSHDGRMPDATLQPAPEHAGGALRLLPLCLLADAPLAGALADGIETELIGRGEAGAQTADWLMRTLGATLEHARYLSRNDLLAMTCVQYEHVNLAPLWTLLETALLAPQRTEHVLSARGLALSYADGRVAAQSPADWLRHASLPPAERAHAFAGIVFELRQYAALLAAHHLPLALQGAPGDGAAGYLLEPLETPDPDAGAPVLLGHQAPGLGVVAVSVSQPGAGSGPLAHGYPLKADALGPMTEALTSRFGAAGGLHVLGGIALDAQGRLGGKDV